MSVRWRARRSRRRNGSRWRRYGDWLLALALLAGVAFVSARLERIATREYAGAVQIVDGDSLRLLSEDIRLRGIDAPELDQQCVLDDGPYACGRRARAALNELVQGRRVICEGWEFDKYGRLLARCTTEAGDLAQRMVESGWAISYGDFRAEEARARANRRGLWAGSFDQPQDWRSRDRSLSAEPPHDWFSQVAGFLRQLLGYGPAMDTQRAKEDR
ncbi:thermonuclease family protein [Nitratireductor luteus]|uniref:thermonuclease family protein n=1 Tax=Nitratireductor luteus TaxID=2976980 RepID=UPI00223FAFCA|nr:thermonuclease family protein [Nitratireductor luteus]